ncbi:MAG TPA: hypothetical protein VF817_04665, partial [Patescibacteria group bacterium]
VLGKLTDQILNNKGLVLGVSTEKNEQPDRSKTKPLQESSLNYPLLGSLAALTMIAVRRRRRKIKKNR